MGFLRFLRSMVGHRRSIKIMSEDGCCKKYKAPLSVKEVLLKHPHHLLFNAETIQKLGPWARPLPESRLLDPGRLYVLVLAPTHNHNENDSPPQNFHSIPLAPSSSSCNIVRGLSFREENEKSVESRASSMPHQRRPRVSFALAEDEKEKQKEEEEEDNEVVVKKKNVVSFADQSNKESMELSRVSSMPHNLLLALYPSTLVESRTQSLPRDVSSLNGKAGTTADGSTVVRVKVVVRKKQLESLLQDEKGEERRVLLESLASSVSSISKGKGLGVGVEEAPNSTWKPSLDCILESKPCPKSRQ